MLKIVTINTVIEHLSDCNIDRFEEKEIIERIKNIYEVTDIEAAKVYRIWRSRYLNKSNSY